MPRLTRKRKQKLGKTKRKRGGVRKLFTVYTLALGNPIFDEITVAWTNTILNNILQCIPESYTDINIIHYEPYARTDVDYIQRQIIDIERVKPRVREPQFIPEVADIDSIQQIHSDEKDYIIFSFTESIQPTKNVEEKEFMYIDYEGYMGFKNGNNGVTDHRKTYRNINAVGFDMYGADRELTHLTPYKFFDVNPDGNVVTLLQQAGRIGCIRHITSLRNMPEGFGFGYYIFKMFERIQNDTIRAIVNEQYGKEGAGQIIAQLKEFFGREINDIILNYINVGMWQRDPISCEDFSTMFKKDIRGIVS